MTPRAILLDLDDTILDDAGSTEPAWREVCGRAAAELDGISVDALLSAITRERNWFWSDADRHREGRLDLRAATRRIVGEALARLGIDRPDLTRTIADTYRDRREAAVYPFPGALEALERLRQHGIALAMITNGSGPAQRAKIERFDLARHFDHIFIEGEVGFGKPDPRVYGAAMDALKTMPNTTWMVGDNLEWEIAVPQRLGLFAIWMDPFRRGLPADTQVRPNRIIHSLAELI